MSIERTLSIVKPDGVGRNLIGEVYRRFESGRLESDRGPYAAPVAVRGRRLLQPCIVSVPSSKIW